DLIDVHDVFPASLRRKYVILVVSLLMFAAVAGIYLALPPRYTAITTLALERGRENVVNVDQVAPNVDPDSASVDTEVEVLRSPGLIGQVVDKLHLSQYPEFNPGLRSGRKAGAQIERNWAIATVLHNLTVKRNGFSYAIDVAYEADTPAMAAHVANTLADLYIKDQIADKAGTTTRASIFLEGQLENLRQQVETAEAAVAQYRADHDLFDLGANSSVTQEELTSLNQQLAQARAQQAEAQARLSTAHSQLAKGSTGEELGQALDSPVVSQLRAQRALVSSKVAALSQQFGPKYPDLVRARHELQDIDDQIASEVKRIVANLSIEANAAAQRTASIQSSLGRAEGTLAVDNKASVGLSELERRAESARTLYQTFLDRYKQTRAQRGLESAKSYLVAKAQVPGRPSSPNLLIFGVLGIIAAIAGSTIAVAILQLLDRGVETTQGLEERLKIEVLGSIPDVRHLPELGNQSAGLHPTQLIVERPQSSFAESFRWLQTSIQFNQRDRSSIVVAITSALPSEGKTTAAFCLARSAALAGKRTVGPRRTDRPACVSR
ncbi:MAG: exopolysaccharide transport family protein, partial [Novosphingobium sp.]